MTPRRGRRPLPSGERQSEVLRLRVTPAEADAVYRGAVRRKQSVSAFLRSYVLRGIVVAKEIPSDESDPTIGS